MIVSELLHRFFRGQVRETVTKNTVSQIIGKVIQSLAAFFITVLIARRYGPEGYGDFTKIITFVPFFYLLADFGLNALYIRNTESDTEKRTEFFRTLIHARVLLSTLLFMTLLIILFFIPTAYTGGFTSFIKLGIILYAPSIFAQALLTTVNAEFQRRYRYDYATVAIAAGSLVSVLGIGLFIPSSYGNAGILWSVASLLTGSFVSSICAIFLLRRIQKNGYGFTTLLKSLAFLKSGIPLALTLVFNLLYFRADILILTFMRTTQDVGIYGFAYKFFEFPLFIPTFFMNAVFPHMVRTTVRENSTNAAYKRIVTLSFWVLLVPSLVISIMFWVMAPLLVYVRPEFAASITALRVLSLGLPFFFLSSLTMWIYVSLGRFRELTLIYFISMVVNIGANFIYIPAFGYMASAWITTLTEALTLFLSLFLLKFYRIA